MSSIVTIPHVFNTTGSAPTYRLTFQTLTTSTNVTALAVYAYSGSVSQSIVSTTPVSTTKWIGINETFTITDPRLINLRLDYSIDTPGGSDMVYVRNLHAYRVEKAEVQDSEMQWAGRRTSYYEGTKMSATEINVDSPDTVDGGPVITVNTVSSTTPSSNPIGTSIGAATERPRIPNANNVANRGGLGS